MNIKWSSHPPINSLHTPQLARLEWHEQSHRAFLACLNSSGTIDADYRGEIKAIFINLSNKPNEIEQVELTPVEIINETERGTGGFGHTGKQ